VPFAAPLYLSCFDGIYSANQSEEWTLERNANGSHACKSFKQGKGVKLNGIIEWKHSVKKRTTYLSHAGESACAIRSTSPASATGDTPPGPKPYASANEYLHGVDMEMRSAHGVDTEVRSTRGVQMVQLFVLPPPPTHTHTAANVTATTATTTLRRRSASEHIAPADPIQPMR
jgi:hypothetical protein